MKLVLIFALGVLASTSAIAEWVNPSEKYLNSYKMFVDAKCPIAQDKIKHFVYFARDREAIYNHPFLGNLRFEGAQIMYSWAQLELIKGQYDFSIIHDDYNYLKSKGKKLFIQLQDATFNPKYKGIPDYLETEEYDRGAIYQRSDSGVPEGWTAKRWNKNIQARFVHLLKTLGQAFDGKIEGINLQESAIGVSHEFDKSFTPSIYVESLKTNMLALKKAFPISATMQYANFMPGEWLPWEDKGYLKSIYQYGEKIGVGLGAPDLMVRRKGQLNHALAMMHEHTYSVPIGIAVQDGNYIGQTNSTKVTKNRENIVPLLHAFAKDFLKVTYMFWVNQEPYFQQDVLPCFTSE
ncbi:hypothetical protein KJ966_00590 [bacterium]|nr:hypothetical protein [bacterium]